MAKKKILASAAMEKLLKKAGADRVSNSAKEKMAEVIEEYALHLGSKAVRMSRHAGRKTVKAVDIVEARKH